MAQNLNRGTPARLLVLLVLLTGAVVVSAWRDALQRPVTGTVRYPTAAGDPVFFKPGAPPVRMASVDGVIELQESPGPPLSRRDDLMFRLYPEIPLPFRLYTDQKDGSVQDPGAGPALFARIVAGKYIRLEAKLMPLSSAQAAPETR